MIPARNDERHFDGRAWNVDHVKRMQIMETMRFETDVLVIGTGGAGLRAAIEVESLGRRALRLIASSAIGAFRPARR